MNKSVPTLLGIVIILLVVVLVVLYFNFKMTQELGSGATAVGTRGGELLTGVKAPKEEIGASEVLGAREPEGEAKLSPAMKPGSRASRMSAERQGRQTRRAGRAGAAEGTKPGG
ncbi:MAG: hypothetical protein ACE149_05920 [Armatimonadota bacterium]